MRARPPRQNMSPWSTDSPEGLVSSTVAVSAVDTGGRTPRLGACGRVCPGPVLAGWSLGHTVYRGARLATQSCTPAGKEGPPTQAPVFS